MGCWICCDRIQVQDLQHPGPSATLPGLGATYCSRTWICCSSTRVCLSTTSIYCSIYIGTPGHGRIAPDPGSSPAPGPGCCEWRSRSATTFLSDAAGPQRPPPPPVLGPCRRSCAAPWCVSFTIHRSTVPVLGPRPSPPVFSTPSPTVHTTNHDNIQRINSALLHDTLPVDLPDLWPSDILTLVFSFVFERDVIWPVAFLAMSVNQRCVIDQHFVVACQCITAVHRSAVRLETNFTTNSVTELEPNRTRSSAALRRGESVKLPTAACSVETSCAAVQNESK